MTKYFHGTLLVSTLAVCFSSAAFAQDTKIIYYCPGGQGTTTSTNIVIRNYPLFNSDATLVINKVIIYDQNGKVAYRGIPSTLTRTVSSGLATGFSTKDVVSPNTGRVSILVNTTLSASGPAPVEVLAVNLDTDSGGATVSRDTFACSK